ncbi:MAG: DUF4156 domain-containing protein [Pseudomonadota bacterium]|nr:DUF4156 domain-containing protein [Pseudomonadota bacterium]
MKNVFALLFPLLLVGCSWVTVTPKAEHVLALPQERVTHCEKLGEITVTVLEKIWFLSRREEDISRDLERLAKNNAVNMGGDTVAPLTKIADGQRKYGIYRCLD